MNARKVVLMILDGWGLTEDPQVSAIAQARTPFFDRIWATYPHAALKASEEAVGLPRGQFGNSEVGHMNLGAGRIVWQELPRISQAFELGTIEYQPGYIDLIDYCKDTHRPLHLMGLLSDGGVHSHIGHWFQMLNCLAEEGITNVYLHVFTDGRDTSPTGGVDYLAQLVAYTQQVGVGQVASVVGRYFAMDRDKRWERVKEAYDLLTQGIGTPITDPIKAVREVYASGTTDEFIRPLVVHTSVGQPLATIQPGDAVLNMNFRTDRGRQITQVLTQRSFPEYEMHPISDLYYATMTRYDESYTGVQVLFDKQELTMTLGETLARYNRTQLRIAETEKYPHVTFFFNGGREEPFSGEDRILCPSPKVATYDLKPEMSAYDLRDRLLPLLETQEYDFICLNFANPDMVGHTGVFEAAVKACEVVDSCAESVVNAALEQDYTCLILADHGNADRMRNPDGSPHTAHTTALVPLVLVSNDAPAFELRNGILADVAPTILALMGLPIPPEMSGQLLTAPATVPVSLR
jgi:2,3-bisphosphoglycerate-independent phosphoglycerate mutase